MSFEEYKLLPEPRTVRLKFCKTGSLQYISHLDLQRTFGRILARADLPLWFTKGFNPHPKLVFGLPLSIGCESVCELADIRIERDMPCDEILRRMKKATVRELDFMSCYVPERKFTEIAAAGYAVRIEGKTADFPTEAAVTALLTASPLLMTKRTKSGEKETDIVPQIFKVRVTAEPGALWLRLLLSAGDANTLNPELVVEAMRRNLGFPGENAEYSIVREYLADAAGKEFI